MRNAVLLLAMLTACAAEVGNGEPYYADAGSNPPGFEPCVDHYIDAGAGTRAFTTSGGYEQIKHNPDAMCSTPDGKSHHYIVVISNVCAAEPELFGLSCPDVDLELNVGTRCEPEVLHFDNCTPDVACAARPWFTRSWDWDLNPECARMVAPDCDLLEQCLTYNEPRYRE
jgi:hypothetical protein